MLPLVTIFLVAAPPAGPKAAADFTSVPLGTFEPTACSPRAPSARWEGLLANVPQEIGWGDPLPLCGLLRVATVHAGGAGTARVSLRFGSSVAGNTALSGVLFDSKTPVPAYFNFDALEAVAWASLPPGAHHVTVDASWGLSQTEPRELRVRASGWRSALSEALAQAVCAGHLLEDLKDYLRLLAVAAVEMPASAEAAQAMTTHLTERWASGFSRHRAMLAAEIRQGLARSRKPDPALPWYASQLVRSRCPARATDSLETTLEAIHRAITHYEL